MSTKVYSTESDCEAWRHTELHDVVCEFVSDMAGEITSGEIIEVFEGELHPAKASNFLPDIVEALGESAYDDLGEVSEGWPDINGCCELQKDVGRFVDAWFNSRKMHPGFGFVKSIKPISIEIIDTDGPEWRRVEP